MQADKSNSTSPLPNWVLPSIPEILDQGSTSQVDEELIKQRARLVEDTLASLGAPVQVVEISRGPTFTQFGVEPLFIKTKRGRTRVPVSKIISMAEHLPLGLSKQYLYIQFPVPGRAFVGIGIPNRKRTPVTLREIHESDIFLREASPLRFALGRDVAGTPLVPNLAKMPHLLITGATGSGKSVCAHAILTSLLLHNTPNDLRLVLIDTKRIELSIYNSIPHMLAPVIIETDRVLGALQWLAREMDKRYHVFAKIGVRKIGDYNTRIETQGGKKLPFLLIVIDELANLMNIAPSEIEGSIKRLVLGARATGIHFIVTTLQLSKEVLPDSFKDNFPARATFDVTSKADSIFILGQAGAERLLGRGDMLFKASPVDALIRVQGAMALDDEIQRLVDFWRVQVGQVTSPAQFAWEVQEKETSIDPLLTEAVDLIRREGRVSVSMLQRKFRIGYTRASRLVDQMEEAGIVSPPDNKTGIRNICS